MTSDILTQTGDLNRDSSVVVVENVSSSGFESGPPASQPGATPGNTGTVTLSMPPCQRVVDNPGTSRPSIEVTKVVRTFATQTVAFCVDVFSSKTCLELLPTLTAEQRDFELKYF